MCVTTLSALMAIAWTIVAMCFSGLSEYWFMSGLPLIHFYELLVELVYPVSAALVIALLLSPVFAVAGDIRRGNFSFLLSAVIPVNVFGFLVVLYTAAAFVQQNLAIVYAAMVAYILMHVARGVFQATSSSLEETS